MRRNSDAKKGFTIIEVSLVIAIAGLIFLMVFGVLPSLQRLARDSQRKEDVAKLMESIKKYQTNNRGALPTNTTQLKQYLGTNFVDPDGEGYNLSLGNGGFTYGNKNMDYTMYIRKGAQCDGEKATSEGVKNPRKIAIIYRLEGSGVYCDDM